MGIMREYKNIFFSELFLTKASQISGKFKRYPNLPLMTQGPSESLVMIFIKQ